MIPETLATYRLTRLVVKDGIMKTPRDAVLRWALKPAWGRARHPKIAELVECPWCVSMYAAAAVLVMRRSSAGRGLLAVLALSAAAGGMAEIIETIDKELTE